MAVFRPHRAVIAAAHGGILVALALCAGIALASATGQVVPPTPLAALPVACLTVASSTALGYTIATHTCASARRSYDSANETSACPLVPVGSRHGSGKGGEEGHPLG
jgi:hypothetical protein